MKPVVTYRAVLLPIEVGAVAFVLDIEGHPSFPTVDTETSERGNYARTSMVETITTDSKGDVIEFETRNTTYRKAA